MIINSNSKRVKIPPAELRFIKPNVRQKIFKEIYTGYTTRYGMKLVYGYLNSDPELFVDYCIIYKARNDDNTADIIVFDVPPIHSDRSTPAYRYCRRTNQQDKFFEYGVDNMVVMEKSKFYEFITLNLGFSTNRKDDLYWKRSTNYRDLLQGLLDLSLRYNKKPSM